jgi:hypothetical protein
MRTTTTREWNGTEQAWLWVETGEGQLLPVAYIRADCWVVTGRGMFTNSWCCHWGSTLYLGTAEEAKAHEAVLQADLAARRVQWDEYAKAQRERNAALFGGGR